MSIRRGLLVALPSAASCLLAVSAAAQDGQVIFERTGYRLTSLGARVSVAARVLDARRRAVPNAPIAWRIQDSAVATVTPRGEVISRRVGRTRVWAVSGRDSASALILVDQWAARFSFTPPSLRFDAVDERKPLQVQARDASGNTIPGVRSTVACRVVNERIAALGPNGQVQARATGVTWLRCADRGVADSVRIEVRQRPVRAAIIDKGAFAQKTVGDTFQIRLDAADAAGTRVLDARPTWASLDARVVNIDPLSGRARAVGVGTVKIVAQVGDITDTVSVSVVAGAGMVLPSSPVEAEPAGAPVAEAAAPRAVLRVLPVYPAVGDTLTLDFTARDASGTTGDANSVRFRSSDSTILRYAGRGRILGVKEGSAYIVAAFSGMTDSALINVRARGSTSTISTGAATNFVRPGYDTAAANRRNRAQVDSVRNAILRASPIRVTAGRSVALSFMAAQASHTYHPSETQLESRTGLLYGGRLAITPIRSLTLTGDLRFGTLVAGKDVPGEDLEVTEAESQLVFSPWNALALRAGYSLRAQVTPTATTQWQFASIGVLSRLQFVGGRVGTFAAVSLLPLATVDQSQSVKLKPEPTSLSGESGIEVQTGFFNAALSYYVERFTFPVENLSQRRDQFSMLRLRIGLQVAR